MVSNQRLKSCWFLASSKASFSWALPQHTLRGETVCSLLSAVTVPQWGSRWPWRPSSEKKPRVQHDGMLRVGAGVTGSSTFTKDGIKRYGLGVKMVKTRGSCRNHLNSARAWHQDRPSACSESQESPVLLKCAVANHLLGCVRVIWFQRPFCVPAFLLEFS